MVATTTTITATNISNKITTNLETITDSMGDALTATDMDIVEGIYDDWNQNSNDHW